MEEAQAAEKSAAGEAASADGAGDAPDTFFMSEEDVLKEAGATLAGGAAGEGGDRVVGVTADTIVDINAFKDSEALASEFEAERAEAWDAFFDEDDDSMKTRRVRKQEMEELAILEKLDKEQKEREAAAKEAAASAGADDDGFVDAPSTGDSEPDDDDYDDDDDYKPSAGSRIANFFVSLLAIILICLIVLVAIRIFMPDSIVAIKMDEYTDIILQKFAGDGLAETMRYINSL